MNRVIIIGFQDSKLKHFAKHINIYKKLNLETSVYTPGYLTNYDPQLVYPFANTIEKKVTENPGKTLLHIFSGGMYPSSIALDYLIMNRNEDSIGGMIWEASPVECNVCSAARALAINLSTTTGIYTPNSVARAMVQLYNKKTSLNMNTWCEHYFYRVIESKAVKDIPKIAIHSENDDIIPYPEEFLDKHPEIQLHKFPNAEHNKAILSDPDKYQEVLMNFIKKIDK